MQSQLEGDGCWEEVTYFTYAEKQLYDVFCLGLISLFRKWPVVIQKGVVLRAYAGNVSAHNVSAYEGKPL